MRSELARRKDEVCSLCITLAKRENPNIKGCAFRSLGNEFCDNLEAKAKGYGFDDNWLNNPKEGA